MAGSTSAAWGRIFVSYRREETAYPAGWLYDRLTNRFSPGQVFKDVDSIQLGDDFVEVITSAVSSCDVLLALIGDEWLTISDSNGRRRIDDPNDFVRLEIEAALTRKVRVIPILVDGASMPRADELPDSLAPLVRRQALELSPSRFEFDTGRLFKVLDSTLAEVRTAQGDPVATVPPSAERPDQPAIGPDELDAADVPRGLAASAPPARQSRGPARMEASQGTERPEKPRGGLSTRTLILAGIGVAAVIALIVAFLVNSQTGRIDVDSSPVTSSEGIELTELTAASSSDAPVVGDTVTVSYSLTNAGDQPVEFSGIFVGVRDPADGNHDTEVAGEGRVLAPGETVEVEGEIQLEAAGEWRMWPCYELPDGTVCPDEWQVFTVTAN